jgi:hypothetical protein
VARSAPDGYTVYITAAGLVLNRYLLASINYDPVADFAPVTLICFFPNLLIVPNSSPVAVGTPVTGRPPHRPVLAAFPHTVPTSGHHGNRLPYALQRL